MSAASAVATDPEAELMSRVAAGESGEPLRLLIERYTRPLYGLGMRLLGDRQLAEDLVQDSFVRVWRSASAYDEDKGSVRTFVYTIARRAAIDMQRRSERVPMPVELQDADSPIGREGGAPDSFERLVTGIEVREAMTSLSQAHREVLELSFDEDLPQQRIADRLGIPLGTVKTRTYHALRAMKAELAERGIDV